MDAQVSAATGSARCRTMCRLTAAASKHPSIQHAAAAVLWRRQRRPRCCPTRQEPGCFACEYPAGNRATTAITYLPACSVPLQPDPRSSNRPACTAGGRRRLWRTYMNGGEKRSTDESRLIPRQVDTRCSPQDWALSHIFYKPEATNCSHRRTRSVPSCYTAVINALAWIAARGAGP